MVVINYNSREVGCKIVYYGPGLSGKTTNLIYVHEKVPGTTRGDLISLATDADRTLYFDFLPINIGDINGFSTKFQLYTVPGQVFYNATRKLVLRGVDGLIFVADSQREKSDENVESLNNLKENLAEYGMDLNKLPFVLQYNKRDLPTAMSVEELDTLLNEGKWKTFEACAHKGTGVFDTLKYIIKLVLDRAKKTPEGMKATEMGRVEDAQLKGSHVVEQASVPEVASRPAAPAPPPQRATDPVVRPAAPVETEAAKPYEHVNLAASGADVAEGDGEATVPSTQSPALRPGMQEGTSAKSILESTGAYNVALAESDPVTDPIAKAARELEESPEPVRQERIDESELREDVGPVDSDHREGTHAKADMHDGAALSAPGEQEKELYERLPEIAEAEKTMCTVPDESLDSVTRTKYRDEGEQSGKDDDSAFSIPTMQKSLKAKKKKRGFFGWLFGGK